MIAGWVERLDARLFGPVASAPLALARILLGAVLFVGWWRIGPRVDEIFGVDGIVSHVFQGGRDLGFANQVSVLWGLTLVGSLGFSLGLFTRISAVVAMIGHITFVRAWDDFTSGWAETTPFLVAMLALGGAGKAFSVDAYLAGGRVAGAWRGVGEVSGWAHRALLVNLAAIYFMAGWHRVNDQSWIEGDIVWESLTNSLFSRWVWIDWDPFRVPLRVASYIGWAVECFAPVFLLVSRTRAICGVACVLLHIGLESAISVGWWQWLVLAVLPVTLWPQVSQRILEKGARILRLAGA